MANRYDNERVISVANKKFKKAFFEKRGRQKLAQYSTPTIFHADNDAITSLENITHIWKVGDRYFKLAHKFYDDPKYWWIIGWYNKTPTEAHLKPGDVIYIPLPLERAIEIYLGL